MVFFQVSSPAVMDGRLLDAYRCERKPENLVQNSIPLEWINVPAGTGSLAVSMHHYHDPQDALKEDPHQYANGYLELWDIDPSVTEIPYKQAGNGPWYMGANKDHDAISYTSPCSREAGDHEYVITVYALSETPSSLPAESSLEVTYTDLVEAIKTVKVIATATLVFKS